MRLASLDNHTLDGELVLVSLERNVVYKIPEIAKSMQELLDHWEQRYPLLIKLQQRGMELCEEIELKEAKFLAPLPRSPQFLDASSYLYHVELARKARGAEMPENVYDEPLMYQGCSSPFLSYRDSIPESYASFGLDFEVEIALILSDVPMGVLEANALRYVCLVMMINDTSLRDLIPGELEKGFGFMQSKPPSYCSPFATTIDGLGCNWSEGKLSSLLEVDLNDEPVSRIHTSEGMHFNFAKLIAHAAKTRPLSAGTVLASGTISNSNPNSGSCCLVEKRMIEKIEDGHIVTPYLLKGDHLKIDAKDTQGNSLFGCIQQKVG